MLSLRRIPSPMSSSFLGSYSSIFTALISFHHNHFHHLFFLVQRPLFHLTFSSSVSVYCQLFLYLSLCLFLVLSFLLFLTYPLSSHHIFSDFSTKSSSNPILRFTTFRHRAVSTETKVNVSVSVTVESQVCNITPTSHNKLHLLGSVVVNNVGYYSLSLQDLHVSFGCFTKFKKISKNS